MNITFYSSVTTMERIIENIPEFKNHNVRFFKLPERERLIKEANDTDILFVDAMGVVDKKVIDSMPNLRLIQSEGVGYQGVDTEYAKEKGIPVCNNKGVNDTAVAEAALFLMLGCLRNFSAGVKSVYDGHQIDFKKQSFGIMKELSQCTVGIIGFGDIAKKTAVYCNALGARVIYTNRTRYKELEGEYNVEYAELQSLLAQSDIVSLHVAVTSETVKMANDAFFSKMKNGAFLINTARGDLVDNEALKSALLSGKISGAGLDVYYPEPVTVDNPLLDERIKDKLVLLPHIAGITNLTVKRIYKNILENTNNVINGSPLKNRI